MSIKRFFSFGLLVIFSAGILSGCVKKTPQTTQKVGKSVELVYYKLFDEEDTLTPLIQAYQAKHPGVTIRYRKFVDPIEYENLIINELAEGQGPDVFSVPNYWFLRNSKKLSPMPTSLMTPKQFDETFVSVASQDLVFPDPNDGQMKVFAIPLTVDTLGLYYNKAIFDDMLASRGRPAATWEQLKDDVSLLSKKDKSFEGFQVGGIAMGRSDNIARATDILYMLMLQYKTRFYNENISKAIFSNQQQVASGSSLSPAADALALYTSFGQPVNKNYSWSPYMVPDPKSPVKELETFSRGKVAMIFGYSYLYEQIQNEIKDLKQKGVQTIDSKNIQTSVVPQVNDPTLSTDKRSAYASYYAETVARTSKHPQEAWDFLMFLSSKENLQRYNDKTHKPTSRRDMIEDQKQHPIYGVFAEQIGFADSFPIYDAQRYKDIFSRSIDAVLATTSVEDAIKTAENNINNLLPPGGLLIDVSKKEGTKKTSSTSTSSGKSSVTQQTKK